VLRGKVKTRVLVLALNFFSLHPNAHVLRRSKPMLPILYDWKKNKYMPDYGV